MVSAMVSFYRNYRLWIVYAVMTLIVVAPYVESAFGVSDLRLKIATVCPLLLVFLLNDWRTEMLARLAKVEESVNNPEPPTFNRFPKMEEALDEQVKSAIGTGGTVLIDVIGVSAKYSWPYLERVVQKVMTLSPQDLDLQIRICLTSPNKLDDWHLKRWASDCRHSLMTFENYMEDHCESLAKCGISMAMFEYDNLPHWHGVMVNGRELFMGRTEWFPDGDAEAWDLKVGEVEYRHFSIEDHYGGLPRIQRFRLWHTRYVDRAKHLGTTRGCQDWGRTEQSDAHGAAKSSVLTVDCLSSPPL